MTTPTKEDFKDLFDMLNNQPLKPTYLLSREQDMVEWFGYDFIVKAIKEDFRFINHIINPSDKLKSLAFLGR